MPKSDKRVTQVTDALKGADPIVLNAAVECVTDPSMNDALAMLDERMVEFSSPKAGVFAGLALNPLAREYVDNAIDEWAAADDSRLAYAGDDREVIVGAGLHAAIWCAVRASQGKPKPVVIERSDRIGGAFAVSRTPTFYLNSRNRPGPLSVPGDDGGSLNYIPGAPVQASDLTAAEYPTNTDMAWVIRTTLALTSLPVVGTEVNELSPTDNGVNLAGLSRTECPTIVQATGLGDANTYGTGSPYVLTFAQFMRRMDEPFPLRGLNRVAVIGAGDGGKVVIEALTGQGPALRMGVAALDYPSRIDWYGMSEYRDFVDFDGRAPKQQWENCNRSRYNAIGRLLPRRQGDKMARVNPLGLANVVRAGFSGVFIDGINYDLVIDARGFRTSALSSRTETLGALVRPLRSAQRAVASRLEFGGSQVVRVGPAASLQPDEDESRYVSAVPQNTVAIWRYADRTAMAAVTTR